MGHEVSYVGLGVKTWNAQIDVGSRFVEFEF